MRHSRDCGKYSDFLYRVSGTISAQTLLLAWSHRYKNSTVVITICLTVTKYPFLKWQCIFYFFRICFLSSITANTLQSWQYIWATRWLSHKKRELLTLREHLISSIVFGGVRVAHLFWFCVVLLCVFTFWVLSS